MERWAFLVFHPRLSIRAGRRLRRLRRCAGQRLRRFAGKRLHRFAGHLLRAQEGNVAIEFAFVAPPLIAMLLAITQTALVFLAQEGLETAAESAGRLIMTGQVQNYAPTAGYNNGQGMTGADFSNAVCGKLTGFTRLLPVFLDCSRLYINVSTTTTFSAANTAAPAFQYNASGQALNAQGQLLSANANMFNWPSTGFNVGASTLSSGSGSQIVVVQMLYLWPTVTGPLGFSLINQPTGANRLLYATSVLVTEAYK